MKTSEQASSECSKVRKYVGEFLGNVRHVRLQEKLTMRLFPSQLKCKIPVAQVCFS